MQTRRSVQWTVFAALAFLVGCVQICGQRITMRYDREADTLLVLLHYDGVHDSGGNLWGRGVDQLAKFVSNREIMLLDWPFHAKMADLRAAANNQTLPADQQALGKAVAEQVQVEPLGHYRDAMGRLGGAQLITIAKASALVRAINASINAEIRRSSIADLIPPELDLPGTRARILAAAEHDHQWLAIEGHALRIDVPVHEHEWARLKAEGIFNLLEETHSSFPGENAEERTKASFAQISHSLANIPFGYSESAGIVSLRLGDPARPVTIRVEDAGKYDHSLEEKLQQLVKQDVDPLLVQRLAGEKVEPASAGLTALAEWGPPEERVRAMARAAESDDPATAGRARLWLSDFSADWNRGHNLPQMPTPTSDMDQAAIARACLDWCREVTKFPKPTDNEKTTEPPANAEVDDQSEH